MYVSYLLKVDLIQETQCAEIIYFYTYKLPWLQKQVWVEWLMQGVTVILRLNQVYC